MKTIAHPGKRDIEGFIQGKLKEQDAIITGEHLYSCRKCMVRARAVYYNEVIDSWNAKNHGIAFHIRKKKVQSEAKDPKETKVTGSDKNIFLQSLSEVEIEKLVHQIILKKR
jgi:hypothetical protein